MKVSVEMKISPLVNTQNRLPLKQAGKSPAFCAAPDSRAINKILQNKSAQWIFKFANKNEFGFNILALAVSCIVLRPATIMALPGQKKDDKQYLASKSIIASIIADVLRFAFCLPLANAIVHLGEKAKKAPEEVKFPQKGTKNYNAFKFGVNNGFSVILQLGIAALMTMAIPRVMERILPPPNQKKKTETENKIKNGGAL